MTSCKGTDLELCPVTVSEINIHSTEGGGGSEACSAASDISGASQLPPGWSGLIQAQTGAGRGEPELFSLEILEQFLICANHWEEKRPETLGLCVVLAESVLSELICRAAATKRVIHFAAG